MALTAGALAQGSGPPARAYAAGERWHGEVVTVSSGTQGTGRTLSLTAATVLREPFTRRSWDELGYALAGLPLTLAGLVSVLVPLALTTPPLIVAGLPLMALSSVGMRRLGAVTRALALRMLGLAVTEPVPFRPGAGFFGWTRSALTDQPAWRARGYFIAKAPVELASLAAVVAFRAGSLIYIASPVEWAANLWTRHVVIGGVTHRYVINFGSFYLDTWPGMALAVLIGVAGWWLSPWVLRAVLRADKALVASLLGQPALSVRVRQLERSRSQAVEGAEARLRRIERDLHDGAQAELVATAMKLGLAHEKLASARAADPAPVVQANRLVEAAHQGVKAAIAQLRDLARGVHPPVLDQGLGVALGSLAARSPVPVALRVDLPARPSPAIEATVYFCAAELLTNVAKHAGAMQASVDVGTDGRRLRMRVGDDGRGGACVHDGGGLRGLAARLAGVDGTLDIASPPGGPTVIEITVPERA
jgi:signal transduction histidine kinase